jgi:adenylate kinase
MTLVTVKVVGVSGIGKTTLIREYRSAFPDVQIMSYGDYVRRYGRSCDLHWKRDVSCMKGFVLMDEHLEFPFADDIADAYRNEGTQGIFVLYANPQEILRRRSEDGSRTRSLDIDSIHMDQERSTRRARIVSKRLGIPLRISRSHDFRESYQCFVEFLEVVHERRNGPR